MKVLQTVISSEGYGVRSGNAARWLLLDALLAEAQRQGCDLLTLPAGYLRARDEPEVAVLIADMARRAHAAGLGVIGGVDWKYPAKRDLERDMRRGGKLPYHGFAIEPHGPPKSWHQESIRRADASQSNAVDIQARTITVAGIAVLPLTCGEMYNPWTRAAIPQSSLGLVVDSGHRDIRRQLSHTLHNLWHQARCAVLLSQHVSGAGGNLQFLDAQGTSHRVPIRPNLLQNLPAGVPWAAAVIRTI